MVADELLGGTQEHAHPTVVRDGSAARAGSDDGDADDAGDSSISGNDGEHAVPSSGGGGGGDALSSSGINTQGEGARTQACTDKGS